MARILIVDDDPDVLRIVEKVLKSSGHNVYTAPDAIRAMDYLNTSMFDVLISDANMPHFSGFELVRNLKNNKKFNRMAIAMLTGLREKKDIDKAIRSGVDDYIVKPIDPMVLLQKVDQLLAKKPPMEKVEFLFPEQSTLAKAHMTVPIHLCEISETGISFKSHFEVPEAFVLEIAGEIFNRMQILAPPMKVISCKKLVEFEYMIQVAFTLSNDTFQQKIRAWIHAQGRKKGAA